MTFSGLYLDFYSLKWEFEVQYLHHRWRDFRGSKSSPHMKSLWHFLCKVKQAPHRSQMCRKWISSYGKQLWERAKRSCCFISPWALALSSIPDLHPGRELVGFLVQSPWASILKPSGSQLGSSRCRVLKAWQKQLVLRMNDTYNIKFFS